MAREIEFNPDLKDIVDIISKYDGNINKVCKHYGIARSTIYNYINRTKDAKTKLQEVRDSKGELDIDAAESVIRYCMGQLKENPKLAQDTAKYVLDRRGHKRGWGDGGQTSSQDKVKGQLEDISAWTDAAYEKIKESK